MRSSQRPRAGEWAVSHRQSPAIFRSYGQYSTIVSGICLTELENSPIAQLVSKVSRILDDNNYLNTSVPLLPATDSM